MPQSPYDIRLATPGGVITAASLRYIAETSMSHGDEWLHLTSRQEIVLRGVAPGQLRELRRRLPEMRINPSLDPVTPNVTTSRAALGLAAQTSWLSQGHFDTILEALSPLPSFPVSVGDPLQDLAPNHMDVLNFLAAEEKGFWHVSVNLPRSLDRVQFVGALPTDDIPRAVREAEALFAENALWEPNAFLARFYERVAPMLQPARERHAPSLTEFSHAPGFTRSDETGELCLTLSAVRRPLPAAFVHDVCVLALSEGWPAFGLTPWSSLLVRGFRPRERRELRRLLVRHRLHVSQAAPSDAGLISSCPDDAGLVRFLSESGVAELAAPGGLSLALVPFDAPLPDTHIVLQTESSPPRAFLWRQPTTWRLYVRDGFDLRASRVREEAVGLSQAALPEALTRIVARFANEARAVSKLPVTGGQPAPLPISVDQYVCSSCDTEYDKRIGDPVGRISPGVDFPSLPPSWTCPVCGGPKSAFVSSAGRDRNAPSAAAV